MALIPAERLVDWTSGTATGVPGGIPGYADGPAARTMYVNALTGELGAGGMYGGTLAEGDGSTDDTAALQAMLDACPSGQYVYVPEPSVYYKITTLGFGPSNSNITLKGDGPTLTLIKSTATTTAFIIGDSRVPVIPDGASAADMEVVSGLAKGATTLTIGDATNISVGQMVLLNVDLDEDSPDASTASFRFLVKQWVKVTGKTSDTITFFPPLYSDYGGGTIDAKILVAPGQSEGVGIEDLFIEMDPVGQTGFDLHAAYGSWILNCRIKGIVNYAAKMSNLLQCEVRHNLIDPRDSSGTSGAGILVDQSSACLVEDNVIVGEWITIIMMISGGSGNAISRNFGDSPHTYDTNHAPSNQFNVWEGNAGSGSMTSDGYFGGERYATFYNNYVPAISLKRFSRDTNIVGNVFSVAENGVPGNTGFPNIVNESYTTPGAEFYPGNHTVPWRDWGMDGTTAAITMGTGTGYLAVGAYAIGATAITVDTGSGTILTGDLVTFSGSAHTYIVESFSGGVINLGMVSTFPASGAKGLLEGIADNATVTISKLGMGTGTGYQTVGSYGVDDTEITVDTGSGTILPNDVVSFAGSSFRYHVVSFIGGVVTISTNNTQSGTGLRAVVGDNVAMTVSTDYVRVNYSSGLLYSYDGFNYQYPYIHWDSFALNQRYRVAVATASYAILINDQSTPNAVAAPAISTDLDAIGPGSYIGNPPEGSFQELDLGVEATLTLKGNRYADGYFDPLGGDSLPSSLIYGETRPAWLDVDEAEYPGSSFDLMPFDPEGGTPASNSDIPAGFRFFFLVDPEFVSAGINTAGNEVTFAYNKPVQIGAGGSGGATASGGITLTFDRVSGSTVVFTTSRIISEGEAVTVSYVNPGNGIEAVSNGNDVPNMTDVEASNSSSVTTGVVYFGPDEVDMTSDYSYPDSGTIIFSKATVTSNGNAVAVRWYIAANDYSPPVRVILCAMDGTKLGASTSNGNVAGFDRWQSLTITSTPVIKDTDYLVGVQFLGNGDPVLRKLEGQGANASYYAEGNPFGSPFPDTVTGITGVTYQVAIQLRVVVVGSTTFDGSGSTTFTGAGSVTFG